MFFKKRIKTVSDKPKLYYTIFYKGESDQYSIIHSQPAVPYADDLAKYPNYFQVTRKPTYKEAQTIFSVCKPNNLCAGIKSAVTIEL